MTLSRRKRPVAGWALALLPLLIGCGQYPYQPPQRPDQVTDFNTLFGQNCIGCHGADGKFGPAPPLNDALFLAIVTHDQLREVIRNGRHGTMMPAFSSPKLGRVLAPNLARTPDQQAEQLAGPLTAEQVDILVQGIRTLGQPDPALKEYAYLLDADVKGDAEAGKMVYSQACAVCHGDQGEGVPGFAGPLNDPAFLALISDQAIRRIVFTGRPDLLMPNYKEGAGTSRPIDFEPLTPQQIADVAALLASWRKPLPQLVQKKTEPAPPK